LYFVQLVFNQFIAYRDKESCPVSLCVFAPSAVFASFTSASRSGVPPHKSPVSRLVVAYNRRAEVSGLRFCRKHHRQMRLRGPAPPTEGISMSFLIVLYGKESKTLKHLQNIAKFE
jgi:hypothetical protein